MKQENEISLIKLPEDVLIFIGSFLDPTSLFKLARVAKIFNRVVQNNLIWSNKSHLYGIPKLQTNVENISYKKIHIFLGGYHKDKSIAKYLHEADFLQQIKLRQKFIRNMQNSLISELRAYVLEDRCKGTGVLRGFYKFINTVQSIFSWFSKNFLASYKTTNLSSQQKKDVVFFNNGAAEVDRADVYFSVWDQINNTTVSNNVDDLQKTLFQYHQKISDEKLSARIKKCRQILMDHNEQYEQNLKKLRDEAKSTERQITYNINQTAEKLITQDSKEKEALKNYKNLKDKSKALAIEKDSLMAEPYEMFNVIDGRGMHEQRFYRKGHGEKLKTCSDKKFNCDEDLNNIYTRHKTTIDKYEVLSNLSLDQKLEHIKEADEQAYYQLISSF